MLLHHLFVLSFRSFRLLYLHHIAFLVLGLVILLILLSDPLDMLLMHCSLLYLLHLHLPLHYNLILLFVLLEYLLLMLLLFALYHYLLVLSVFLLLFHLLLVHHYYMLILYLIHLLLLLFVLSFLHSLMLFYILCRLLLFLFYCLVVILHGDSILSIFDFTQLIIVVSPVLRSTQSKRQVPLRTLLRL